MSKPSWRWHEGRLDPVPWTGEVWRTRPAPAPWPATGTTTPDTETLLLWRRHEIFTAYREYAPWTRDRYHVPLRTVGWLYLPEGAEVTHEHLLAIGGAVNHEVVGAGGT